MNTRWDLERALELLGRTLEDRGLSYAVTIAGGAALLLTDEIDRPTRDIDIVSVAEGLDPLNVARTLPEGLRQAADDVADALGIPRDWLNNGAVGIVGDRLPAGFDGRTRPLVYANLVVHVLARTDLLCLKLWAAADQGPGSRHLHDIRAMRPDADELAAALRWVRRSAGVVPQELADVLSALDVEGTA